MRLIIILRLVPDASIFDDEVLLIATLLLFQNRGNITQLSLNKRTIFAGLQTLQTLEALLTLQALQTLKLVAKRVWTDVQICSIYFKIHVLLLRYLFATYRILSLVVIAAATRCVKSYRQIWQNVGRHETVAFFVESGCVTSISYRDSCACRCLLRLLTSIALVWACRWLSLTWDAVLCLRQCFFVSVSFQLSYCICIHLSVRFVLQASLLNYFAIYHDTRFLFDLPLLAIDHHSAQVVIPWFAASSILLRFVRLGAEFVLHLGVKATGWFRTCWGRPRRHLFNLLLRCEWPVVSIGHQGLQWLVLWTREILLLLVFWNWIPLALLDCVDDHASFLF